MASSSVTIGELHDPTTRAEAFGLLVKELSPQVYAQIRRMVLFHDDADDVMQNTFMKAWMALDSYRGDSKPSTWIYRIALNECLTFLQRQRSIVPLENEDGSLVKELESDPYFDGDELALKLQQAIAKLPDKQRIVFNLKYFDEMKYEEMSELLQTSVGALKASYHLAVAKVRSFFDGAD